MLRRALAVSFALVLALGSVALAGQALPIEVLRASDLELDGLTDALELLDQAADIYHPAGSPGFMDPGIDIRRVEVIGWALRGETPDNPFLNESLVLADILGGGATERSFAGGAPYINVTTTFEGMLPLGGDLFCEFPFAWYNPNYEPFRGIEGDLFNGTNHVLVVRAGGAVPDGFEVENLIFFDGAWGTLDPIGWGALSGDQVTYTVPHGLFGPAGDAFRMRSMDLARGGGTTDAEPVDMNFGSFCSEGGRSFDPSLGGVDILQAPVDLGAIPIGIVQQQGAAEPTTTTTLSTATSVQAPEPTTPPTSVVAGGESESGGGISPAVIAAILGGLAAAAYAARRAMGTGDDTKRPPGFSVRLDLDSGTAGSFSDISGLPFEETPIEYRDGLSSDTPSTRQPGLPKYANITLKRGFVDADGAEAFEAFAQSEGDMGPGSVGLFLDEEPTMKWSWDRSWAKSVDGPGLKSTGNEVAMETLELKVENPRFEAGR